MPAALRPKLKKLPAAEQEGERLRVLHDYAILDTPPEAAFERIVRLAAHFLQMPIALVSLVDKDRQWFKAAYGLDIAETPRRLSFCAHTIEDNEVMVVPDARRDPRFADNPLVTGDPFLHFYAGAPLESSDGQNIGTLCVLDRRPREFDEMGRQLLRELAATVVDELELRHAATELRLQVSQRERAERELVEALRSVESQVEERTAELSRQEALAALRARQQQTVAELGATALTGGEVDSLLHESCRVVQETLRVEFCGVAEHLPDQGIFVARTVAGAPGGKQSRIVVPDGAGSGSGYVLMTGEPVIIPDTRLETRFQIAPWIKDCGVRSGMVVLIGGDGTHLPTYGTFNVFSRPLRDFTPDDVFFLQGVANVLAAAISRRRAEEALRVAKEEAELANSAKGNFLSRMSHELRTPLNAILGFSQLLQMDASTERQQECIQHVLTSGQQLLALIDDVLDISRLELGRGTLTPDAIVAGDAVASSIDLIRPLAAPRRVAVERADDGPAAGRAVLVNRQRLQQVLLNLLSNAVKYNQPGGRVTVSCRVMPTARLRISVTDTGPGIAPENFTRLFVPFDRLGAERSDVQGTGLGLALCKNLVEAQGGQIGVESTPGEGSTFWVQFPLAPPAPAGAAPSVAPVVPPAPVRRLSPPARRVPRRRTRTILYIEDNFSNLRLIERLLQRHRNVRLLSATLGRQGLEIARRRRPDLVLLDSHLPDLSGGEVLAALQADPATRPIPVIIVSADALPASIEALRSAGARDYLTKPLDVHALIKLLGELT